MPTQVDMFGGGESVRLKPILIEKSALGNACWVQCPSCWHSCHSTHRRLAVDCPGSLFCDKSAVLDKN